MFDIKNDSNAITIQNSYDEDLNFRLIEIKYYNNEKYFLLQNENNEYSVYKYDKSSSAFVEITNNKLISMLFGNIGLLKNFQSWFENYLLCIPILVLFLYPVSELILWIIAHVFPMIWSDKFSVAGITDFATKYLLYAYHPNINWFQHLSINMISIGSFGYLLFQYIDDSKNKIILIIGNILAFGLIYAMFVPAVFDTIGRLSAWLIGIGIFTAILAKWHK